MHFKGFTCIRKLQEECQIPAAAYDRCQIVISFKYPNSVRNIERQKNIRKFLGDWLELWPSIVPVKQFVDDLDHQCITQHPGYDGNCLNQYVIQASFYEFLDDYGHVGDDEETEV